MTISIMTGEMAVHFNEGCDARLDGIPRSANPIDPNENYLAFRNWDLGWRDVHIWWGAWERFRPVKPLPEVEA
jgi:hypothetical protein